MASRGFLAPLAGLCQGSTRAQRFAAPQRKRVRLLLLRRRGQTLRALKGVRAGAKRNTTSFSRTAEVQVQVVQHNATLLKHHSHRSDFFTFDGAHKALQKPRNDTRSDALGHRVEDTRRQLRRRSVVQRGVVYMRSWRLRSRSRVGGYTCWERRQVWRWRARAAALGNQPRGALASVPAPFS